ncbi:hypothetical protein NFI96_033780, partial [Prochilodus magdalenae]
QGHTDEPGAWQKRQEEILNSQQFTAQTSLSITSISENNRVTKGRYPDQSQVQSLGSLTDTAGKPVMDECGLQHFRQGGVHIHHSSGSNATATGISTVVRKELLKIKKRQHDIFQFLNAKQIKYFMKDVTESPDIKEEMRKKVGNPQALPPQVFSGEQYCGDYDAFFNAVEDGEAEKFFKLG